MSTSEKDQKFEDVIDDRVITFLKNDGFFKSAMNQSLQRVVGNL